MLYPPLRHVEFISAPHRTSGLPGVRFTNPTSGRPFDFYFLVIRPHSYISRFCFSFISSRIINKQPNSING
jgi:hypothetical protein